LRLLLGSAYRCIGGSWRLVGWLFSAFLTTGPCNTIAIREMPARQCLLGHTYLRAGPLNARGRAR